MSKGDQHMHWGKPLWETGEFRRPEFGEHFFDHADWRTIHRLGWDGVSINQGLSDGRRTILSPYQQDPEKKIETPKVMEWPDDYTGPESCYCAATHMPPCSWCTDPNNNPETSEAEDDKDLKGAA